MAPASKRRKTANGKKDVQPFPFSPVDEPATEEDREKWKGWCDIESEPAYFNYILSRWGVRGARLKELYSMDPADLDALPQPTYGLVFLFRYRNEDALAFDAPPQPGAGDIWFARQCVKNSCASVALMNLIMNVPGLDIGQIMTRFRKDLMPMRPSRRGLCLAEFTCVRQIHNTWARKTDMMKADLLFKQNVERKKRLAAKEERARKNPSRNPPRKAQRKAKAEEEDLGGGASAFHFIAYIPVGDDVWKMDGLDKRPTKVDPGFYEHHGRLAKGWLGQAALEIQDRMSRFADEGVGYNIMVFTKDPMLIAREGMIECAAGVRAIGARLEELNSDWRSGSGEAPMSNGHGEPVANGHHYTNGHSQHPQQIDPSLFDLFDFSITIEDIQNAHPSPAVAAQIFASTHTSPPNDPETLPDASATHDFHAHQRSLKDLRASLLYRIFNYKSSYRDEQAVQKSEAIKAEKRKMDYIPIITKWFRWLAEADHYDENGVKTGKCVLEVLCAKHKLRQ